MKTANWLTQVDQNTAAFRSAFGGLKAEQLNWKPNPDNWSIAQIIDHVIITNQSYFPVLKALQKGNYSVPFVGKIGFFVRFLGNFILKSVQPDRKNRMKTFPVWEPSTSKIDPDILDRFEAQQALLKQSIADAEGLVARGAVISSPVNKNIVYKLETAFDIIIAHEQRHLEQAKEVLRLMTQ